jgi:hypothetical protein
VEVISSNKGMIWVCASDALNSRRLTISACLLLSHAHAVAQWNSCGEWTDWSIALTSLDECWLELSAMKYCLVGGMRCKRKAMNSTNQRTLLAFVTVCTPVSVRCLTSFNSAQQILHRLDTIETPGDQSQSQARTTMGERTDAWRIEQRRHQRHIAG